MQLEDLSQFASVNADEALHLLTRLVSNRNEETPFVLAMLETATGQFTQISSDQLVKLPDYSLEDVDVVVELIELLIGEVSYIEVKRGRTVIGHCYYPSKNIPPFDTTAIGLLPFLFNRRQYERFSKSLNSPVPFDVSYDEFFYHLQKLAKASASSTHGAYRALNGHSLDCLFAWGFEKHVSSTKELSLDLSLVPQFKQAVETQSSTKCWDLRLECPELMKVQKFQSSVRSFCATPVEVGAKVVGLLTIGAAQQYDFTSAEQETFRCISNGIGVSISNYKNFWRGKKFEEHFEEIASSINGLEVVHQIKHNIIDNSGAAFTTLDLIERFNIPKSKMSAEEKNKAIKSIGIAKRQIGKVNEDVKHIGDVISFDRMIEKISIKEIWDEVKNHLTHRIQDLGVKVSDIARDQERVVISGAVKHIFQNLMLNSLDAFKHSNRHDKQINLRWISTGSHSRVWKLRYSDNGPGLAINILKQQIKQSAEHPLSEIDPDIAVGEYIFLPKVTTKAEGTGQGLFLSRNMANQHQGGIQYNNREEEGVSFDIEICFDLEKVFNAARRPLFYRDSNGFKQQLEDVSSYFAELRKLERRRPT